MGIFKTGTQLVRNLFTSPDTNSYPKGEANLAEGSRGAMVINEEACTLCGLCARRCPSGAIITSRAEGRWLIDRMKCIACGECVYECPEKCLDMVREYISPENSVVIDIFNVEPVEGSDSVLRDIEMPPSEEENTDTVMKSGLRLRDVQYRRRRRRNAGEKKRKNRAAYRNRNRNKSRQ